MKNLSLYLFILIISISGTLLSFVMLPKHEIGGKKLFDKFIQNFDKAELPYHITFEKSVQEELEEADNEETTDKHQVSDDKMIRAEFASFVPNVQRALYSRTPPDRYYFKDVIFENENMIVVTYGAMSFFNPNHLDTYMLATYSKNEKLKANERLISLKKVASRRNLGVLNCAIDENLRITTTYKIDGAKDDDQVETEVFQISDNGKIKVVISSNPFEQKPQQQKEEKIQIRAF